MKQLLCLLFMILNCFNFCVNGEYVPVFIWGTKGSISTPALEPVDPVVLSEFIRSQTNQDTVTVVFYENHLTLQDFSKCKEDTHSCFTYLESIPHKSFIPYVEHPLSTLKENLPEKQIFEIHLNSNGKLDDVKPNKGSTIFVSLADTYVNEEKSEIFKRHDNIMKDFFTKLSKEYENVIAVYTGKHSTTRSHVIQKRQVEEKVQNGLRGRYYYDLKDNNSNTLLNLVTGPMKLKIGDETTFVEYNITTEPKAVKTNNQTLVTIYVNGNEFTFEINFHHGYWNMENFKFKSEPAIRVNISVSDSYSYSCSTSLEFKNEAKSKNKFHLFWTDFQLQPYKKDIKIFQDAYNCVNFTSPTIWSGLFISFIFIFILTIGFAWLFDIKTMDRFDDPKGKTITVTEME